MNPEAVAARLEDGSALDLTTGCRVWLRWLLDHLCRNRACLNPAHLEAVTHRENMLRANTHCRRGHELTPENAYTRTDNGHRICRVCKRIRDREYYYRGLR